MVVEPSPAELEIGRSAADFDFVLLTRSNGQRRCPFWNLSSSLAQIGRASADFDFVLVACDAIALLRCPQVAASRKKPSISAAFKV